MDPLSLTASVIAITQAASGLAAGVRALKTFNNGPAEFGELLDDLGTLEGMLELTRRSVEALQTLSHQNSARAFAVLQTLEQQLRQCTSQIEDLTKRILADSKGMDKKGRHRISRTRWLREKDNMVKLRTKAQRLHLELSTCFSAVDATHGCERETSSLKLPVVLV
jgi:hypothetical protein